MLLIGRTAASVEARTTPRNSEMDRPASRGFTAWTRLARLFTTFGRLARSHSPTRNVLILPKDSAWFRLAAQILETRSRADGLAPAPPCVAFRHRDVLTLWIEQSGSHRSVRPKGTFVGRPNVRAYDGFRATGSSPCPRLQCRITRTRQLRRKTRNHHMQSPEFGRTKLLRTAGSGSGRPTAYRFVTVTLSCGSPDRGCYEAE